MAANALPPLRRASDGAFLHNGGPCPSLPRRRTVRVYRESWEVIEVQMDTHRRGTGSEPYWVSSKAYLPSDHPLFKLVKGALEGPCSDAVDASIAEDRVKFGRAA